MRLPLSIMAFALAVPSAFAAPPIDENYIKSLASPGKRVLVIEYYDGQGGVAERKGFASAEPFTVVSPTELRANAETVVHLYGVEPCEGEMVNRAEDFSGTCEEFAVQQLEIMMRSASVLFCRAFMSELGAPKQNATCYAWSYFPPSLDAIDMIEEQLVSLGALRVAKGQDGRPLRTDLDDATGISRSTGLGMQSDPRTRDQ